jgi:ABC-type lipoprotein release transport system permease subunit
VSREISPGFVSVIVVSGLVLILFLASLGPSRRAMRTQPASLLRQD